MPKYYKKQNYNAIKKNCLKSGTLFDDPEFPATSTSLYHTPKQDDIEWLRPKEICKVPRLVVEGVSSEDLVYDDISRSWFASACMALANEPNFWGKVVPEASKQEYNDKNPYAGVFRFNVWRFGEWMEVVVDDRLPTRNGKLVYCRSASSNEFWSALLEKAYAKMHGDYEALLTGSTGDAMVDFTGGILERIDYSSVTYSDSVVKDGVFLKMKDAFENKALINCTIRVDPTLVGTDGPHGLVNGMGYIATKVMELEPKGAIKTKLGTNKLRLIRLFSPNSKSGVNYNGPWSAKSQEMSRLPVGEWEKQGVKYDKEEEFWMQYTHFMSVFTDIEICHFINTSFFSLKKKYSESMLFGEWSNVNGKAGGGEWDSDTVLRNPQFFFDVGNETDTVVVSIEQKDMMNEDAGGIYAYNIIGFYIMKVEQNRKFRVHTKYDLRYQSEFVQSRNVYGQTELDKGHYVIIPCCANVGSEGEFLLRLYTSTSAYATQPLKECPTTSCCVPAYKVVTNIEVIKAEGLKLPQGEKGPINPFIVIVCEGSKVASVYQKETDSPKFNTRATFYRKKPQKHIIIEVHNKHMLLNSFICQAYVQVTENTISELPADEATTSGIIKKSNYKSVIDLFVSKYSRSDPVDGAAIIKRAAAVAAHATANDQNNSGKVAPPAAKKLDTGSVKAPPAAKKSDTGSAKEIKRRANSRQGISVAAKIGGILEGGEEGKLLELDFFGRKKESGIKKAGKLFVFLRSSDSLESL